MIFIAKRVLQNLKSFHERFDKRKISHKHVALSSRPWQKKRETEKPDFTKTAEQWRRLEQQNQIGDYSARFPLEKKSAEPAVNVNLKARTVLF